MDQYGSGLMRDAITRIAIDEEYPLAGNELLIVDLAHDNGLAIVSAQEDFNARMAGHVSTDPLTDNASHRAGQSAGDVSTSTVANGLTAKERAHSRRQQRSQTRRVGIAFDRDLTHPNDGYLLHRAGPLNVLALVDIRGAEIGRGAAGQNRKNNNAEESFEHDCRAREGAISPVWGLFAPMGK